MTVTEDPPFHGMLGRRPARFDARTLKAAEYMEAVSPPPPAVDWQTGVKSWPMYANDQIGDCTVAAAAHLIGEWTADASGVESLFTDPTIIEAYAAVSGYDPKTGTNDNGAVCLDVLNYWRKSGIGGRKIAAFVKLDPHNRDQVKQAINLFGGVYLGVALPLAAQHQVGGTWSIVQGPSGAAGSWGGHAVPAGKYDGTTVECVTWGATQAMTWAFFDAYVEEAFAVVSPDWIASNGTNPQGFNLGQLLADLAAIGKNQPTPAPRPEPPPIPPPPVPIVPPPSSDPITVEIDASLLARVHRAADKKGMTGSEWVNRHLHDWFSIR